MFQRLYLINAIKFMFICKILFISQFLIGGAVVTSRSGGLGDPGAYDPKNADRFYTDFDKWIKDTLEGKTILPPSGFKFKKMGKYWAEEYQEDCDTFEPLPAYGEADELNVYWIHVGNMLTTAAYFPFRAVGKLWRRGTDGKCTVVWRMALHRVEVDLDVDSNSDGIINDQDDDTEDYPGVFIPKGTLFPIKLALIPNEEKGKFTLESEPGIRIWTGKDKKKTVILPKEWKPASSKPDYLYVEGIDYRNTIIRASYYNEKGFFVNGDKISLYFIGPDLDVDSDNDGIIQYNMIDEDDIENPETPEDIAKNPGKIFPVNNYDIDNDGIPDYCDGFNANPDVTKSKYLKLSDKICTELKLQCNSLPDDVDLKKLKYTFTYAASDPKAASVEPIIVDDEVIGYNCSAPEGLRIWLKKYSSTRNKNSIKDQGDFVSPGMIFSAEELGMTEGTATFYIEATPGAEKADVSHYITVSVSGENLPKMEDTVRINPVLIETPKLLVCHDPYFEKRYCLNNNNVQVQQARLMHNKAEISVTKIPGLNLQAKLYRQTFFGGKGLICNAYRSVSSDTDSETFLLRTDKDGIKGADTDEEGRVYVEGKLVEDVPGNYFISIESNGRNIFPMVPIKITPLLTDLRFSPKIEEGKTFDPYSDEFDIEYDIRILPKNEGEWYGMGMHYKLYDNVAGVIGNGNSLFSVFGIENDQDASPKEQGDIKTIHILRMNDNKLIKGKYDVKWEGFNDDFDLRVEEGEQIDEIYKDDEPASLKETWGPPDVPGGSRRQSEKGIGAQSVCAEGKYNMRVELKPKDDDTQIQKYSIKFEVKYDTK